MATGSRVERKKYQKKHRQRQPRKKSSWVKKTLMVIVALVVIGLITGGGLFTYYALSAPKISQEDLQGQVASKIYDRDGQLIKSLGGQNRDRMKEEEIPPVLKDAVLAIEDNRFYHHHGVDFIRIMGALVANLKAGSIQQGGSTITQQLVKLSVFSTKFEDQTLERKAQEAWLAIQMEKKLSKDQILTYYLNKLFYSNNVYGAKTAAKVFFGKDLADITLAEAALLAGIPQAPTQYDPYAFPEEAKKRRDLVLQVMLDRQVITQSAYQEAINTPLESSLQPLNDQTLSDQDVMIDAYLDVVAQEVQDKMNLNIYTDGLEVYTNLDLDMQDHLYKTVHNQFSDIFPNDDMQTAVSIVDVDTGQLYAVIGGRNQKVAMGLNRAATLNRSVGSTIKPLSAYGPAIEYLNYSTGQYVVDEPYTYSSGSDLYNYDMDYKGKQTMREALVGSRNIPALKMLQKVGLDQAYSFLQKMDINIRNNNQRELVEANAIGGEISPIQLSAAYAAISNYGVYHQPYTVNKVITQAGTEQTFESQGRQAMRDSTAYMLIDMLKGVPGNFATGVNVPGVYQAGKTGTTNYTDDQKAQAGIDPSVYAAPDAWYAGISPQFAIATWVGYDNPLEPGHYISAQETTIPQEVYSEMMTYIMQNLPNTDWVQPDSVDRVEIEKYTDPIMKPSPATPSHYRSMELFIKGTDPKQVSQNFRIINPPTGFTADYNEETQEIEAKWDPVQGPGVFELTLNGQVVYSGTETEFKVPAPAPGQYELGLRILEGSLASDTLIINFDLTVESETSEETTIDETGQPEDLPTTVLPPEDHQWQPMEPNVSTTGF